MITSIRIDDNKKTPFEYIQKIKAFKNGSEFIFKPGVNVIVGKNGSGKSTLLNMISKYMLCEKKMCSELPSEALYEKGYKGHKDDVLNRPIERDYRLSRPTKIKKIGKKLILKDEGK